LDYQYHISGAVKSAVAYILDGSVDGANSVPKVLYSETLYYEDCDSEGCTPQYNGNISRMVHHLAHGSPNYSESRDVAYAYDMLNRLTKVEDDVEDYFDEIFNYDAQGRIVQQRRGQNLLAMRYGGEYSYYTGTNQLEKVMGSMSIDDSGNKRDMSAGNNFLFDRDGNMIEDKSKEMTISYDHRGLPVEFKREVPSISGVAGEKDSVRLTLAYDGAGSRITKKRERKVSGGEWTTELVTHYTGIGSEIREDAINNATKVVVNLPQGLGRYDIASASEPSANTVPSFEWYLKNHLGSTMLVYGTQSTSDPTVANLGSLKAAYDYRAFGEQVDLTMPTDKVTETFTGKEKDDETELSYFGARYLDQMLGLWVSVDAKRQFNSPYLYAGNGVNPINGVDEDGNFYIPPALAIGTVVVVKHLVTRVLPRYATKAMDIGMKVTNPANVGKAAKVGAIGEIVSRVNPSVEKAFDDLVFGASNGISNEVSSTLDLSKTITETLFDNLDGIVNSISDGMNSKLEKMQNTPVEDLVD
jgi:RHS repeat-associated protein